MGPPGPCSSSFVFSCHLSGEGVQESLTSCEGATIRRRARFETLLERGNSPSIQVPRIRVKSDGAGWRGVRHRTCRKSAFLRQYPLLGEEFFSVEYSPR